MFKKSILALAAALTLGSAISASAFTAFFAEQQTQQASDFVTLGDFNAPGAGTVEIFDYRLGTMGDLLGTANVTEGANSDVRIELSTKPEGNVVAVLKVGDETIGMEMIRILQ